MTRPLRLDFPGALHHVHNRGVQRRDIFLADSDRVEFLGMLGNVCSAYRWSVHVYTLMTNHFHLGIETHEATISRGMQQLTGDYADYFNRRHRRDGHLFQGRFKSHLVEKETYLLNLAQYVVLNPVRAGMVDHPADWPWSSYRATAGLARARTWLETDWILDAFDPWDRDTARRLYEQFVAARHDRVRPIWSQLVANFYLGSAGFIERLRERFPLDAPQREESRQQRRSRAVPTHVVRSAVEAAFAESISERRWRNDSARAAFAELARRHSLATWGAVADVLSLSVSGARKLAMRTERLERDDPSFRAKMDAAKLAISQCKVQV
jgi:putative transposase